jgi:hypothetical protein
MRVQNAEPQEAEADVAAVSAATANRHDKEERFMGKSFEWWSLGKAALPPLAEKRRRG